MLLNIIVIHFIIHIAKQKEKEKKSGRRKTKE